MIASFDSATTNDGKEKGAKESLWTRDFTFMTLANFFDYLSVQMMVATLPLYVIKLGGTKASAGVVAGAMGITAMIFRPLMGWLTDRFRRRRIILLGMSFHGLASVAYVVARSIPILMLGRAFHGFGSSCYNTASTAYIADIAPPKRRAEAMGLFSATSALGQVVGPAIGFIILRAYNFHDLFLVTAGLAFAAVILSCYLREKTSVKTTKAEPWTFRTGIIAKDALPAAWIILCIGVGLGAVQTFIALFSLPRGFHNPGLFFTTQAIGVLVARTGTGRLSDRYGRAAVLVPGLLMMVIALGSLQWTHSPTSFLTAAAIFGLGYGAAMPTSMALLIDSVRPEQRGLASSTYFLGLDAGTSAGSILMGMVSQHWGFGTMWSVTAACTLLGLFGVFKSRPGTKVISLVAL